MAAHREQPLMMMMMMMAAAAAVAKRHDEGSGIGRGLAGVQGDRDD